MPFLATRAARDRSRCRRASATAETRGLAAVAPLLARIDAIRSASDASAVLAELNAHGIDALLSTYADADFHDVRKAMISVDKGSLGLDDPASYTRAGADADALRAKYRAHLERLFRLLDPAASADRAAQGAARTLALETSLAKAALSLVESRHLETQDHPMTLAILAARYPAIAWTSYFAALGAPPIAEANVEQPVWLDAVNAALATPEASGVRDYVRTVLVRRMAAVLPRAIEDEVFDFHERTLRGAREMAPRWKRCLTLVDRDIGDDVGRIFLARYFGDAARSRMQAMVNALLAAYRADIDGSDWLGPEARAAAEAKLAKMLVVIGASNRPRTFDGLEVREGDPFGNAWRAKGLDVARQMADLAKPVDREKFFDALPQQVDGFGSKPMNATGFTAGFLQPPVFDPAIDDAVNYGGIGSVIGHELTHRFDDEGRKFDGDGNLRSWWSPEDVARFEERARCFADEYSRFRTDDGTPLDGKLTLGENVADNGGIRLSYAALRPSEVGPKRDGFTPAQRFFLAWGQIRCENVTPEVARRQAQTDVHSAGRWRVDGVVANMPEFARAFGCAAGAPMAPETRCKVW